MHGENDNPDQAPQSPPWQLPLDLKQLRMGRLAPAWMPDIHGQEECHERGEGGDSGGKGRQDPAWCSVCHKIRELAADWEEAGFVVVSGGKGSHRKFRHPRCPNALILSGRGGDDAHPCQEKQLCNGMEKASQ